MNIERLNELADRLDTVDAQRAAEQKPGYDQSVFIHDCGTPGCALGEWAVAHPDRWVIRADASGGFRVCLKEEDSAEIWDTMRSARAEFEITVDQSWELFSSSGCGRAQSGKAAAAYIRDFIARDGITR